MRTKQNRIARIIKNVLLNKIVGNRKNRIPKDFIWREQKLKSKQVNYTKYTIRNKNGKSKWREIVEPYTREKR